MNHSTFSTGRRRLLPALLFLVLASTSPMAQSAPKKMLVITESRGFTHGVVKRGDDGLCVVEKTLAHLGKSSGVFETVNSQNAIEALTKDNLAKFDALFFYTTGTLIPAGEPREALLDFVKSGKAFIGAHSATDTFADFKGYYQFINGTFNGHPWNAGTTSTFVNHEPSHPTVEMFPASFQFKDEIYQYKNYDPKAVRVLLSLDMSGSNPKHPYLVPVAWVRTYGDGRLFYTNLGHNQSTWENDMFQAHLISGIRWAFKLIDGPSEPNPEVQALEFAKGFLVVHAGQEDWAPLYDKLVAKSIATPGSAQRVLPFMESVNQLGSVNKDTPPEQAAALKAKQAKALAHVLKMIEE